MAKAYNLEGFASRRDQLFVAQKENRMIKSHRDDLLKIKKPVIIDCIYKTLVHRFRVKSTHILLVRS